MQEDSPQQPQQQRSYTYPNQLGELSNAVSSLTKLLLESSNTLSVLRRELRGEGLIELEDGRTQWVQVCKPVFVKVNNITEEPMKQKVKIAGEEREIFVPNDEAIEEILSIFSSMGLNKVTPLTNLKEDTILDDLRIFGCKLAACLCLKQKEWGLDKEMLPMTMTKIYTMIQDARYQAREGTVLRALTTTVQRI